MACTKKQTKSRVNTTSVSGQKKILNENNLADEFKVLTKNIRENLAAAWNSEQKKKVQKGVDRGFEMMVKGINTVIKEAQKGTLDDKVKKGVHKVLREANVKLEKSKKVWKPAK